MDEIVAYIGIGSNLDDPEHQVQSAVGALARLPRTRLLRVSRLFRTPPWGIAEQPPFVNAAAAVGTQLSPRELLDALLAIERARGRHRDRTRWGPRVLDLDILLYGDRMLAEDGLRVPHPHLAERAFVLLPLADLDADLTVPGRGHVRELLDCVDIQGCSAIGEAGAP